MFPHDQRKARESAGNSIKSVFSYSINPGFCSRSEKRFVIVTMDFCLNVIQKNVSCFPLVSFALSETLHISETFLFCRGLKLFFDLRNNSSQNSLTLRSIQQFFWSFPAYDMTLNQKMNYCWCFLLTFWCKQPSSRTVWAQLFHLQIHTVDAG